MQLSRFFTARQKLGAGGSLLDKTEISEYLNDLFVQFFLGRLLLFIVTVEQFLSAVDFV